MINNLKEELENFFDKELSAVVGYILTGCIANDSLINKVVDNVELFENEIDYIIIEHSFENLCDKINELLSYFNNEQNIMKKYDCMMYIRGLFSLLEGTVENSLLTKNTIKKLELKWGSDFLNKIATIDGTFLSEDGATYLNRRSYGNMDDQDNLVKTYLVLKKYQDITHKMYLNLSQIAFKPFIDTISDGMVFKNAFMKEQYVKDNYINEKLKSKVHTLEEVSKYISFGFGNNVKQILGGKAFGLGVLYLLNQDVPKAYCIPINYDLECLDLDIFNDNCKYSIRSSANIEDGEKNSFAGMFDSYLNIEKKDILIHCKKVLNSINNQRVKDYINKFKLDSPLMAIIVQEFVMPKYSGIWMGSVKNSGVLEFSQGSGEKIVSGHVVPSRELWSCDQNIETGLKINDTFVGKYFLNLQKIILEKYNVLPDFEWCVINNKIKLLQYRAVTTDIIIAEESKLTENELEVVGIPCSAGEYEGFAQFVRTPDQLKDFESGNILLSVFTDPEWLCGMDKAGAIVTAMGGFLCHSAIISRELKIPCITGIGIEGLKKIKNKKIKINGSNGEIIILD